MNASRFGEGGARGRESADGARGATHHTHTRTEKPCYQLRGAVADIFTCPSVAMPQPFGALLSPSRRVRIAAAFAAAVGAYRHTCSPPSSNSSSTNNNNNNNNASVSTIPYRCRWLRRARSGQSHRRAHVRPARPSPSPSSS